MRSLHLSRFVALGLALALGSGTTGCRRDGADTTDPQKRALQWAADASDGAPYVFKDVKDPDKVIGFEKDLADALAKELGRPIEFKQYEFERLFSGLERGDFDFAMNGLEITPERQAKFRFSRPYYVYQLQLVVRADEDEIKSWQDLLNLAGKEEVKVGTLGNTAAERLLDEKKVPKETYTDQLPPFKDLELKRTRAVLMDLPIALYYAKKNPKLKFAGEPFAPGLYGIAFRPDQEELAKQFDAALGRLIENGELKKIYEKWGLWNDAQNQLSKPPQ